MNRGKFFSVQHLFMDFRHFDRPDYFAHELLMEIWNKKESGPVEVSLYRRSMEDVINVTTDRFILERVVEPQPSLDFKEYPEARDWYRRWYERSPLTCIF